MPLPAARDLSGEIFKLVAVVSDKPIRFVKLRNPWGSVASGVNGEWTGMWSDGHIAWQCFPDVK